MTAREWQAICDKLTGLWPKWNPSAAVMGGWQRIIGGFRYEVLVRAIDAHWEEAADKWEPSHKAIKRLAIEFSAAAKSERQLDVERRFEAMTPLEKARALRDYHAAEATNANLSDHERERHENIADTAAKQVKRLHAVEQWRETQPPAEPISELELMALCGHARTKR